MRTLALLTLLAIGGWYGPAPVLIAGIGAALANSTRSAAIGAAIARGLAIVLAMFWGCYLLLASTLGGEPPTLRVAASAALLGAAWLPRLRPEAGRSPALLGLLAFGILALDGGGPFPEAQAAEIGLSLGIVAAIGLQPLDADVGGEGRFSPSADGPLR